MVGRRNARPVGAGYVTQAAIDREHDAGDVQASADAPRWRGARVRRPNALLASEASSMPSRRAGGSSG